MTDPYHVIEDLDSALDCLYTKAMRDRYLNGPDAHAISQAYDLVRRHLTIRGVQDDLDPPEESEQYVIVPAPANMEVIGPFETMEDAASFADNYYAGQVNCCIRTIMKPEEE